MFSRTADHLFWMARYTERADAARGGAMLTLRGAQSEAAPAASRDQNMPDAKRTGSQPAAA
ncbi:alpha-E domain-containing protein [Piscinibacterium candidicorallinum]|uniref:Alpha-E domain-containing protein n=1 Tax=Piscinibacterium candidicorallinum TaxID=1793872 RepID=A0ABV7H2E5_9BURK